MLNSRCDAFFKQGVPFSVVVTRGAAALGSSLLDFAGEVRAQNNVQAAACALSLAGGGAAVSIQVTALQPRPGRPVQMTFFKCSQGAYGFVYASRSAGVRSARR